MMQLQLDAYQDVVACPVCGTDVSSAKALGPHFGHNHPEKHCVSERIRNDFERPPGEVLRVLHHGAGMSVLEIAERFNYPRVGLTEAFERYEVDRDTRTGLEQLWEDNREYAVECATEHAALGAPARETNGMAGVTGEDAPLGGVTGEDHPSYGHESWCKGITGQDHPNWRGGKSVYDAVKKLLGNESWATTRERIRDDAGRECEMCGKDAEDIDHRGLDVHHLIPIMAGGTNGDWNLIALCSSCHHKAEWYARQEIPETDPILVE